MNGNRKSIRLSGYDYSQKGLYFVTIDLESKNNLLWKEDNVFQLNEIGKLMENCWLNLEERFPVELDEYVIMPNHFHGILGINGATRATTRVARTLNPDVGAGFMPAQNMANTLNPDVGAGFMPALGNIIGAFKSIFVWEYIQGIKNKNWPKFYQRLWQRDYFERIIRNKAEYLRIKQYIKNNPIKLVNLGAKTNLL